MEFQQIFDAQVSEKKKAEALRIEEEKKELIKKENERKHMEEIEAEKINEEEMRRLKAEEVLIFSFCYGIGHKIKKTCLICGIF